MIRVLMSLIEDKKKKISERDFECVKKKIDL
jgi:hypothetical protein